MAGLIERLSRRLDRERMLAVKAVWQNIGDRAAATQSRQTVLVTGLPRSGTNMLMDALERSLETQVFHERDPRAFDNYDQHDSAVIRQLITRSPARHVIIKALLEGHKIRELMREFAPSKAVWMYRHYDDTLNSDMANWPGTRNKLDDIVVDRDSADWRGRGMTDDTYALVRRHYSRDMSNASALGLYFYYRHQLFFDQGFDTDPDVYALSYEDFVADPQVELDRLAGFLGLRPTPRMARGIHARSIRRKAPPDIAPEVRALAEEMYQRLERTRAAKLQRDRHNL